MDSAYEHMFASGPSILKEVVCSMSLKIYFTVASTAGLSAPVSARSNYRQLVQMLLKCVSLDGKCSGFQPEC